MLSPTKHLDLDKSAFRVGAEILNELRRRRMMEYDAVVRLVKKRTGDDGDSVVAPALNLLFLMGCIEYHSKNDSFEYCSKTKGL